MLVKVSLPGRQLTGLQQPAAGGSAATSVPSPAKQFYHKSCCGKKNPQQSCFCTFTDREWKPHSLLIWYRIKPQSMMSSIKKWKKKVKKCSCPTLSLWLLLLCTFSLTEEMVGPLTSPEKAKLASELQGINCRSYEHKYFTSEIMWCNCKQNKLFCSRCAFKGEQWIYRAIHIKNYVTLINAGWSLQAMFLLLIFIFPEVVSDVPLTEK